MSFIFEYFFSKCHITKLNGSSILECCLGIELIRPMKIFQQQHSPQNSAADRPWGKNSPVIVISFHQEDEGQLYSSTAALTVCDWGVSMNAWERETKHFILMTAYKQWLGYSTVWERSQYNIVQTPIHTRNKKNTVCESRK